MDGQKDSPRDTGISRFFDGVDHVHPFVSNQLANRAYRRAERIVAGLFIATNHLAADEVVRIALRAGGIKILEEILALKNELRAPGSSILSSVRASLRYLISLLRMLGVSGSISPQNMSILITALDDLALFLESAQSSPLSESVLFSRQDFIDVSPAVRDIKDKDSVKDMKEKDVRQVSNKGGEQSSSNVRQKSILEVLGNGGDFGIPDIASHLPEYSTKTIQRDLGELIAEGRVKRLGLKRWSRYSLVK